MLVLWMLTGGINLVGYPGNQRLDSGLLLPAAQLADPAGPREHPIGQASACALHDAADTTRKAACFRVYSVANEAVVGSESRFLTESGSIGEPSF